MNDRAKAIAYLSDGHSLLRKYGLYGKSDEAHYFAIDRALTNLTPIKGTDLLIDKSIKRSVPLIGGVPLTGAAEAAAALQALYEAKRLVTSRSSIEGRRIILGDWFTSLAVSLAMPLRNARLAGLMSEELSRIGTDANSLFNRLSRHDFCETIDRFTNALCEDNGEDRTKRTVPIVFTEQCTIPLNMFSDNKLLNAIGSGFHKTAANKTRSALSGMEAWFKGRYAQECASETDGWIFSAIMSGGKRMRPMLARLCAGLGTEVSDESSIISIMSAIELMHSASLVHDDIVDRSPMRRSRATINAEKGDGYAAMCGFIMIADALRLIGSDLPDRIVSILSDIPKQMCDGELCQLDMENRPEYQSETEYFDRIAKKTAALIEGSCVCGAVSGGANEHTIGLLSKYGHALGLLFQLRDDLLDYGDPLTAGKPVSQDMERGVYSLPLLYAKDTLRDNDPKEHEKLDKILRKHIKDPQDFRYLRKIAESSGGISYTREKIEEQAKAALSSLVLLPQNTWTEALSLIVFALTDKHSGDGSETKGDVPCVLRNKTQGTSPFVSEPSPMH